MADIRERGPFCSVILEELSQNSVTQVKWPDYDAQDNFPPYQVGISDGKEPAGKLESGSCSA